jgi:hypothetical protein
MLQTELLAVHPNLYILNSKADRNPHMPEKKLKKCFIQTWKGRIFVKLFTK